MANDAAQDVTPANDTDNVKLDDEPDNSRLLEQILDYEQKDDGYMPELDTRVLSADSPEYA